MRWILATALLGAFVLSAPVAFADPSHDQHITITAHESGCDEGTFCFTWEGDAPTFAPGELVKVTLVNEGVSPHNVFVAPSAMADTEDHANSDPADALNGTDSVNGGEEANFTFVVPDDATGLYFWCDISGHEQLGMWLDAPVEAAMMDDGNETMDGEDADDGDSMAGEDMDDGGAMEGDDAEQNGSPVPAGLAVAALAIAAATMFVRRD